MRADDGSRIRDLKLGKLALYQLSYVRVVPRLQAIWESSGYIRPDGWLRSERMLSFSHFALGSIGAWLCQTVAGIRSDTSDPGFAQIDIAPVPGGELAHAEATYEAIPAGSPNLALGTPAMLGLGPVCFFSERP